MPTSSQAMILISYEAAKHERNTRNGVTNSNSQFTLRNPAQLTVASVYNINGYYSMPAVVVKDEEIISLLGRASAQLFKYHKLPKGFRSILSFDPLTKTVQWRILGGDDEIRLDEAQQDMVEVSRDGKDGTERPYTTGTRKPSRQIVNRDLYDHLVNLGFRRSDFDISDDSCVPKSATSLKPENKPVVRKTVSEPKKLVQLAAPVAAERKPPETVPSPAESAESDEDDTSLDENLDPDGYYRILPSMYMRKDMPLPKPRSAIFSLRENEGTTHFEMKNLIQTQTGLEIIGLQFDPLNLRASRPDLRSRWIADFSCRDDLETFIRKGLIIGKDKIIVYKYDDIAKREFSTFKYFKTIQDAKKGLKGSKSQKIIEKGKKTFKLTKAKSTKSTT